MIDPKKDGIDHINVYSKGKTSLGRLLSNFAHTPFTGGQHRFESIEGYWYWFVTGKKIAYLKSLYGYKAKQEGRKYPRVKKMTPSILKAAYATKLKSHPQILKMLKTNTLPLAHYYVFNGKVFVPERSQWTAKLWEEFII